MRKLQMVAFFGLIGLSLASGCVVTTNDTSSTGGSGGGVAELGGSAPTATGGVNSVAGNPSIAGSTSSSTTTVPFAAADCAVAATTAPAAAFADIAVECMSCLYTTGCADAVDCHNEANCMATSLKALECASLRFKFNGYVDPIEVQACQDGTGEKPADLGGMTVASTDTTAWKGAVVSSTAATSLLMDCDVACNLADQ